MERRVNPPVNMLLAGDWRWKEFAPAAEWLKAHAHLRAVDTLDEAIEIQQSPDPAAWVILAQSRPKQWPASQVERLAAAAPLARVTALVGYWCQGEMRTGKPWPGIERVYFHHWQASLGRRLEQMQQGASGILNVPRTATPGERLLVELDEVALDGKVAIGGAALVIADHTTDFEAWSGMCRVAGLAAFWAQPEEAVPLRQISLGIFDARAWRETSRLSLARWSKALSPTRVIAMISFPTQDDIEDAKAGGAAAVMAKPVSLADFVWHVKNLRDLLATPRF